MKTLTLVSGLALGALSNFAWAEDALIDLPAPEGAPQIAAVPADWAKARLERQHAKAAYLDQHSVAYAWFSEFPFSQVDGIPMVLLRLLPVVAPDIWGKPDQFGASFGLFARGDGDSLPLPVGIGFSGLDKASAGKVDYTSFTCGACHIGRVRHPDGQVTQIVGGVNAEFNIVKFFVDLKKTLDDLGGDATGDERSKIITARFVQAAQDMQAENPTYVYGAARYGDRTFDAAYETAQIRAYLDQADALTGALVDYTDGFTAAYAKYLDKTYDGFQETMLAGLPGMADATGVSASHGFETMNQTLVGEFFASDILPDAPGLSDFMVVWDQRARMPHWDAAGENLIDGGGQYNGNIPIPIYRNLAASMTMGLKDTDLRVAAFAAELLADLPPEPYPFDVDVALAAKGQALFADNCADCHRPNNGVVYRNLGVDPSRSMVINDLLYRGAKDEYLAVCNPQTELTLYDAPVKPCAEYDGKPIADDDIMRPLNVQQGGYNATALAGIWAAAPYLHNGSVPTIYQLLVPQERPDRFVKSVLSYDTHNLGFDWQDQGQGGYVFDSTKFSSLTNKGHDADVTVGDKTYRLDWSGDTAGALAIVEYLKTL